MIKNILKTVIILLVFTSFSCTKSEIKTTEENEIHKFIWQGLNTYYLWQNDVADLSDTRFSTFSQLYDYFGNFSSPTAVFESLLYQKDVVDRFSWIVDDYIALENSFQGITLNSGMEFGLVRNKTNTNNVFGYVRYVIPNSDAATKNLTRGMIFNTVDGTQITTSNYRDLLFSDSNSYTIGLADYNAGDPISNGTTISLSKTQLQENPVAITKVLNVNATHKVGYLLYNQFSSSFDGQLNAAFATFKSENITELVIDLRYNPGGSVSTATYLASMITGQFNGQVFSKKVWNQKIHDAIAADIYLNHFPSQIDNGSITENINSLQLTKVYFIVTKSSASASELIINGLNAYIDVKMVGTTTYGKHVGSITIYDSDDLTRNGANLNSKHTYAMQPIVFEIKNKNNENAPTGFVPEVNLPEDYGNLGVLGERSDPLLDRAIVYILTGARTSTSAKSTFKLEEISDSKLESPLSNNMYVDFENNDSIKKLFKKEL